MATNENDVGKRAGNDESTSQHRRQMQHPGPVASKLSAELFARNMVTQLKGAGVYDVAEGRPHPKEKEYVDRPVPTCT